MIDRGGEGGKGHLIKREAIFIVKYRLDTQEEQSNFGASLHITYITDFIILSGYLQG